MNALTLLTNEHRRVDRLFTEHKQATGNPRRQKDLFGEIRRALDVHARIEETVFDPALENGLLTPTLKLRRHAIDALYEARYEAWGNAGGVSFAET